MQLDKIYNINFPSANNQHKLYSREQLVYACCLYVFLGNLSQASKMSGVNYETLKSYEHMERHGKDDWWKELKRYIHDNYANYFYCRMTDIMIDIMKDIEWNLDFDKPNLKELTHLLDNLNFVTGIGEKPYHVSRKSRW